MKKIVSMLAAFAMAAALLVSCSNSSSTPKSDVDTPADSNVIELTYAFPGWGGTIADDGTVTYDSNYGEVDLGDGKASAGDTLTVTFAEVPSKVQLKWTEVGGDDHYVPITEAVFEFTFTADSKLMAIQAMNTTDATCKIVKATLTKN